VRIIFDQADANEVTVQFDRAVETLSEKLPRTATHLEEAKADLLAFTSTPVQSGGRSGPRTRRND
jgi:transposase-like protein